MSEVNELFRKCALVFLEKRIKSKQKYIKLSKVKPIGPNLVNR